MEIEFLQDYLYLKKGKRILFNNFTVLTGRNGAGKTNLLNAISKKETCSINGHRNEKIEISFYQFDAFSHVSEDRRYGTHFSDSGMNQMWRDLLKLRDGLANPTPQLIRHANDFGKTIDELTKEDFISTKLNKIDDRRNLFGFKFYEDSANYIKYIESNKYNDFRNTRYGEDNIVYSEEKFLKVHGFPPWKQINRIFSELGLNYKFVVPEEFARDEVIEVRLLDKVNDEEIDVKNLSHGEKTILSLATIIYNSEYKSSLPNIFLFDEPDALLHPEYSKKLISILNDYLVKKLGKQVIMTTHSPSTIAIVPEESIFICEKKSFQIRKSTKDEALQQLTFNVTSLSISHENRRQVFVEDKMDAKVFESIFQKLKNEVYSEISLNFIPISTSGTGGCAKVKSITNALNQAGNKSVYGIIDWDSKNKPNGNILVLGENERDSIESYILDPVLIYAFLLWAKKVPFKKLSFDFEHSYMNFNSLNSNNLQEISNKVLFLLKKLKPKNSKDGIKTIEYLNGKQISLPIWYLEMDGHDLEKGIEKEFPEIIKFKKREEAKLVELIVETVLVDLPEFIPIDFVELFKKIQIGK